MYSLLYLQRQQGAFKGPLSWQKCRNHVTLGPEA